MGISGRLGIFGIGAQRYVSQLGVYLYCRSGAIIWLTSLERFRG